MILLLNLLIFTRALNCSFRHLLDPVVFDLIILLLYVVLDSNGSHLLVYCIDEYVQVIACIRCKLCVVTGGRCLTEDIA